MSRVLASIGRASAVVFIAATSVAVMTTNGHASSAVPYTDAAAHGVIGFCDPQGRQVQGGNINDRPFVWRAVSSVPAPAGYTGTGRTATLFVYQPLQDLPSGNWSGAAMTAAARYTDAGHPMAAATGADETLAELIANLPPRWNGLLEVRLIVGAPNEPVDTQSYPATDIEVTGDTWHVVHGGDVSCSSGTAESLESIVKLPIATTAPKAVDAGVASVAPSGTSSGQTSTTSANSGSAVAAGDVPAASTSDLSGGSGESATWIVAVLVALVIAVAGSAWWIRNRRKTGAAT
jgi:hypothetical protein